MRRPRPARLVGGLLAVLLLFSAYTAAAHPGNRLVRRPIPAPIATEFPNATDAKQPGSPPAAVAVLPACELPGLIAGAPAPLSPWFIAAAMLGLAGVIIRRSRRLTVWASVLILSVFVAESSVHSVHHLTDPRGAAHCQVLSLGQHLHGSVPAGPTVETLQTDTGPLLVTLADSFRSDVPLRPDLGRAPPPVSA